MASKNNKKSEQKPVEQRPITERKPVTVLKKRPKKLVKGQHFMEGGMEFKVVGNGYVSDDFREGLEVVSADSQVGERLLPRKEAVKAFVESSKRHEEPDYTHLASMFGLFEGIDVRAELDKLTQQGATQGKQHYKYTPAQLHEMGKKLKAEAKEAEQESALIDKIILDIEAPLREIIKAIRHKDSEVGESKE